MNIKSWWVSGIEEEWNVISQERLTIDLRDYSNNKAQIRHNGWLGYFFICIKQRSMSNIKGQVILDMQLICSPYKSEK